MGGVAAERVCHALDRRRDGQITWTASASLSFRSGSFLAIPSRLEAIASRLEAIAIRLEAIAIRLEAIASRFPLHVTSVERKYSCPQSVSLSWAIQIALSSGSSGLKFVSTLYVQRFSLDCWRTRDTAASKIALVSWV